MKALVTGGAGFIGSHVVDRLVAAGHQVVVLDNLDPQVHGGDGAPPAVLADHIGAGAVRFHQGDVRDGAVLRAALEGIDTVVHLAAAVGVGQSMYQPRYFTSVNVDGEGALLEEVAREPGRYRRLVVASSMSIYGEGAYHCAEHGPLAPPTRSDDAMARGEWELRCPHCGRELQPRITPESKPLHATSVYAVTKKAQEELALCFGRAYRIPTLALRFFNVFGSRQALSNPYTGVAAIFLSRLKNRHAPLLFEDGLQSRDFIHVADVAEAVVRAAGAEEPPSEALNVCTGSATTIRRVAETLADHLGVDIAPRPIGRYRAGDIRHCVGDPSRAREVLGFEAGTSFEEGLAELIRWASGQGAEDRVAASLEELERQGLVR